MRYIYGDNLSIKKRLINGLFSVIQSRFAEVMIKSLNKTSSWLYNIS